MNRSALALILVFLATTVEAAWTYKSTKDDMRGQTTYFAQTRSINSVKFGFPYHSTNNHATLVFASGGEMGMQQVIVDIDRGQFSCHECKISVKFDDGEIETLSAYEGVRSDYIFLRGPATFITKAKSAKTVTIEAFFFQEGTRQLRFKLNGLKWDHDIDSSAALK